MKRYVACASVVLASASTSMAKDSNAKVVYCTQQASGDWTLNRFKPLIKVQGGTVFAEMSFQGRVLAEVRLRRFYKDSELAFDYVFDASGRLTGLRGSVQVRSTMPPGSSLVLKFPTARWF